MSKVSIITASYNYENYIKETIESVIAQTFQDWEMIIVDDGSTDNSVDVIKSYSEKDSRIKLFKHENGVNRGLAETLQLGIKHASSDWVAFLEYDDTITPEYLTEKFNIIEKYPDVDFIFNDLNMFGDEDVIADTQCYFVKQKGILKRYQFPTNLLEAFKGTHANLISTFSCVMAKKCSLQDLNYKSPIKSCLDWWLWLQIVCKSQMYYIDKPLTNWRMHKSSYINCDTSNQIDSTLFEISRNYFLHDKSAIIKNILLLFNLIRKNIIRIHIKKSGIEIILFGSSVLKIGSC